MRTRRRTLLATGLVALLTIAGVTAAIANDPPPRIAFLANGIVPADALAAGPIAGQLGAPVYTTAPDFLVDSTAAALDAYNPELVIVMGGSAAISDAVLDQVSAATGLNVVDPNPPPSSGIVRAAGQDRFETAAAAAALLAAYDPAYLPTDMKAVDADKLDGKDSSAFQPAGDYLGKTGKAADADKLDGKDSTAFLGKSAKAADSDKLDGKDGGDFATRSHPMSVEWAAMTSPRSVTLTSGDGEVVLLEVPVTVEDECGDSSTRADFMLEADGWTRLQDAADTAALLRGSITFNSTSMFFGPGFEHLLLNTGTNLQASEDMSAIRIIENVAPGSHTFRWIGDVFSGPDGDFYDFTMTATLLGWDCDGGPAATSGGAAVAGAASSDSAT